MNTYIAFNLKITATPTDVAHILGRLEAARHTFTIDFDALEQDLPTPTLAPSRQSVPSDVFGAIGAGRNPVIDDASAVAKLRLVPGTDDWRASYKFSCLAVPVSALERLSAAYPNARLTVKADVMYLRNPSKDRSVRLECAAGVWSTQS